MTAKTDIEETKRTAWQNATLEEVDEGLCYLGSFYETKSRHDKGGLLFRGCMDYNRNQTGGCFCISKLLELKGRRCYREGGLVREPKFEYAIICEEIAEWFRATGELQVQLSIAKKLRTKEFKESFARCIVLKKAATGVYTKMVDMSVHPGITIKEYDENTGLSITHNQVVGTSTLCLNSLLHLWVYLTGCEFGGDGENPSYAKWQKRKYEMILRWCAQVQEDVITKKKKQELFYARVDDYLAAKVEQKRIRYICTRSKYEEKYGTLTTKKDKATWKQRTKKRWQRWNMSTIHMLYAGTNWNFNPATKSLVSSLGISVGKVSPESVKTLLELGRAMETNRGRWKTVRQDRKLLFMPMPDTHNVTSAIHTTFGGKSRGRLGKKIREEGFMDRIKEVDNELEKMILGMINKQYGKRLKKVAFQFTILMAKTHEVQHPHWDYTNESRGKEKFMVAFLPLTRTGQFIQMWEYEEDNVSKKQGHICFIPEGQLVLVPGTVLHGGGFRAECETEIEHAHMRAHFYVYPGADSCMVSEHNNEYTDRDGTELEEIYVNNKALAGSIDDDGQWNECLEWTFFEGKRPFDKTSLKEIKRVQERNTKKK